MSKALPTDLTIDLDALTLGDLEDLESCGADLGNVQSPKTLVALVWIAARKADPSFTLDDARAVPVSALKAIVGGEADPKETAA